MNADLKRVRDTSLEDAPSPTAKRRALSFSSPPIDSSDDSGMEDWMKVVEVGHGGSLSCNMRGSSVRLGRITRADAGSFDTALSFSW